MYADASPAALEAEDAVLGALLVTPGQLNGVLGEVKLAGDHFYLSKNGTLFAAIVAMFDQGKAIDEVTVAAELDRRGELAAAGGRARISELAAMVPVASHAMQYAARVVEKAEWRLRQQAGQQILEAVQAEDREGIARAEALLNRDLTHAQADFSATKLADIGWTLLEGKGAECFPWPLGRLNDLTAGGIRRGEFVVVAGHTSHGKSVFCDQLLEACARRPKLRVRLYMNEMALEERVARTLNRRTGVSYPDIIRGQLSDDDKRRVLDELNRGLPYGITYCPGWSVAEISHHVRRSRWDVAAVDILHEIPYGDEGDLRDIASTLTRTAKQANCALIATAHLNEHRSKGIVRPRPTLGDIRGSGAIKNAADIVAMVWREQDKITGEPKPEGSVWLPKVRNGRVGGQTVHFNGPRLRFEGIGP